ncbi:DEAD/DEAH box helicase [Candidatus Mycoplasma mahonii]|uniref:DEAD/DEAH box helicase n=1 Tax=Candidatus Mycoplasma mahonii TaxID=3004105 RepID=UPI0026E9CCFE|nr:DEAD/DEAH box helicase [Candidatus Mycoplasma mahonii]WKX02432.1 DEAD/DEAH box helicase [Candidatus Mycoplasma mahonii]
MKFKELNLSKELLDTLELIGYREASPIQEKAIPVAMSGNDIIGQAQTGTGKTAAFGIPLIENTIKNRNLQHIILAPSRELATQIYNELHKLSANKDIKVIDIIGGISYTIQKRSLSSGPNIIVATPGRFIDNLDKGLIDLSHVTTFTLDEADEMLNFGFYKEITRIKKSLPDKIQTLFFTATFNPKIKKLATEILNNPVSIIISEGLSSTQTVLQKHIIVTERQKISTLVALLQMLKPKSAIIFGRTKRRVEELTAALKKMNFDVVGIQGDMRQRERSFAMDGFRRGKVSIIVGTDVIARGIDVDGIDYVFNFDLPDELEYFTHRIGRTGRAGSKGTSISFIKETERSYFKQIMNTTGSTSEQWPIPSGKDLAEVKEKQLEDSMKVLLEMGKNKFTETGKMISESFTKEELGIILSEALIGSKDVSQSITLTQEVSNAQRRGVKGGRSSGGRNRGGGKRSSYGSQGGNRRGYGGGKNNSYSSNRSSTSRANLSRPRSPKK